MKCINCGKEEPSSSKRPWEFLCSKCQAKKTTSVVNPLLKGMTRTQNWTLTENLAHTHKSTLNTVLDFFSMGGALRSRTADEIVDLYMKAWGVDKLLAWKSAFYFRDVRGGQGERQTFRTILWWMSHHYPDIVIKNLANIPFYGRWDDLYVLVGSPAEKEMFAFLQAQFNKDLESETPSLLGKWLKSENTSSSVSRLLGKKTREAFGMTAKDYRKNLSFLRTKIDIVEKKMCSDCWKEIDYSKVPSRASMIYRKAFERHDPSGYATFLDSVDKGEAEIKAATLYPYDLLRATDQEGYNKTLELQWQSLPNYCAEGEENSIVVCDTSGSMFGDRWNGKDRTISPIYVSVSLAIYFAERAKGPFHGHFITFSSRPTLQPVIGHTLFEKYKNLSKAHWEMNTDLQAVFRLILRVAIDNHVAEEDMIKKLYIISDMEFDSCQQWAGKRITNFDEIKKRYAHNGYKLPQIVFWNVDSRNNQSPITVDDKGVFLVSGLSPSIFKNLMESKAMTAYDLMLDVLNSPRYEKITI